MTMGEREQRGGVAGLIDDVEAFVREQPRQSLPQEHVVLGDQDAWGVGGHARIIVAPLSYRRLALAEVGG